MEMKWNVALDLNQNHLILVWEKNKHMVGLYFLKQDQTI